MATALASYTGDYGQYLPGNCAWEPMGMSNHQGNGSIKDLNNWGVYSDPRSPNDSVSQLWMSSTWDTTTVSAGVDYTIVRYGNNRINYYQTVAVGFGLSGSTLNYNDKDILKAAPPRILEELNRRSGLSLKTSQQ